MLLVPVSMTIHTSLPDKFSWQPGLNLRVMRFPCSPRALSPLPDKRDVFVRICRPLHFGNRDLAAAGWRSEPHELRVCCRQHCVICAVLLEFMFQQETKSNEMTRD